MSKGQSVNALCKALASIATSYSSSKCHAFTHLLTRGRRHALVNGCRYATGVNPTPAFAVITLEPSDSSNGATGNRLGVGLQVVGLQVFVKCNPTSDQAISGRAGSI